MSRIFHTVQRLKQKHCGVVGILRAARNLPCLIFITRAASITIWKTKIGDPSWPMLRSAICVDFKLAPVICVVFNSSPNGPCSFREICPRQNAAMSKDGFLPQCQWSQTDCHRKSHAIKSQRTSHSLTWCAQRLFGLDRYSDEHWIASHPDVIACDFDPTGDLRRYHFERRKLADLRRSMAPRHHGIPSYDEVKGNKSSKLRIDLWLRDSFFFEYL